mmetsp:Transcript_7413/g.13376  ORF Transcript_7413/g.13376 Transcript_7413/m.13376 type:complete len:540 (-) Transcript_7413:384-2003(-)|eukprot:CAMPEP_0182443730 /NCGR_PEP_ID=MMETSP1172-20130603/2381_1 /TAXON_ID=708627 /ORGANISM="Timspurckia oligopyrenoides, Strain CCMP3278" /LENGTH=539 /DNA_ID=CAMNT_0024639091 /DNA_START=944 /DNA_END=2563 /DNA_ORIENTATION=-
MGKAGQKRKHSNEFSSQDDVPDADNSVPSVSVKDEDKAAKDAQNRPNKERKLEHSASIMKMKDPIKAKEQSENVFSGKKNSEKKSDAGAYSSAGGTKVEKINATAGKWKSAIDEMIHHVDPAVAMLPDGEDAEYRIPSSAIPPPAKNPIPPPPGAYTQSTDEMLGPDSQHAYVQRWVRMVKEEYSGSVKFKVVRNDGTRENLMLLLGLKNVFVKQLPNMPKPYVTRLVFDRKHESMALLKRTERNDYTVMGGCCYRPFPEQRFGEIAFLAISHNEQVRGYGTRLMAHTKEHAKEIRLDVLLTCADNNAVPYFKKQGFSKRITLPKENWQGYIKDYEGVTLMECKLHTKVNYLNIPTFIKAQKMALMEKLKEMSHSHIVFQGIDVTKTRGIPVEDIPGIKAIGLDLKKNDSVNSNNPGQKPIPRSSRPTLADRSPEAQRALNKHLHTVMQQIKQHSAAWPFLEPVDPSGTGAYDYYDIIKNPMDLRTMQSRLDSGWFYITKEIFIADLKRMVENCIMYNGKTHYITELAQSLERYFLTKI